MLTAGEIATLRNLSAKKAGERTTFVNIADAQRLTDLGLAQRSRQGWDITPQGAAYLASIGPDEGYGPLKLASPPQWFREAGPAPRDAASRDPLDTED